MKKPKIIVVVGPTASGKTGLAIALAKRYNGEVISADSRQVYRGLDIGTAKVTADEMQGVPHHLIDVCDAHQQYSAADFKRDAAAAIADVCNRGCLPIIAGGTFFYIDTLLGKRVAADVLPNTTLRAELETKDVALLFQKLQATDPERATDIDPQNKRRIIRALEIVDAIGKNPPPAAEQCPYEVLTFGIERGKETLRARFLARGTEWLHNGFQNEVETLLANGISRERLHEIGFEYILMLELIEGKINESAFLEKFVQKNWQYAKRQLTWLKRDQSIIWHSAGDHETIFHKVDVFLQN